MTDPTPQPWWLAHSRETGHETEHQAGHRDRCLWCGELGPEVTDAEVARCSRCGAELITLAPSTAFLTFADRCEEVPLEAGPPRCPDEECRATAARERSDAALERAIESGLIVREHPPGYDDQYADVEGAGQ